MNFVGGFGIDKRKFSNSVIEEHRFSEPSTLRPPEVYFRQTKYASSLLTQIIALGYSIQLKNVIFKPYSYKDRATCIAERNQIKHLQLKSHKS